MKKSLLTLSPLLLVCLALSACIRPTSGTVSVDELLKNPLYAERYADEMVDRMVEYKIRQDDILEDEAKAAVIEKNRTKWLAKAADADSLQRAGAQGHFIGINEYLTGEVLYLDDQLHFGSTFETSPGPNVHVYFSTIVDPRDTEFPDETAIDLGIMQTPYGAQTYAVPKQKNPLLLRTVVLWDNTLQRLHGFAQVSN